MHGLILYDPYDKYKYKEGLEIPVESWNQRMELK